MISGRLRSVGGPERELDAAVGIGDTLYLFECVSVERPLDYEIGNPKTIEQRNLRLDEKIDQVRSLAEFIRDNPIGANYDLKKFTNLVAIVVSPFEEWIWEKSAELWLDDKIPRILSAQEAIELLEKARQSGLTI